MRRAHARRALASSSSVSALAPSALNGCGCVIYPHPCSSHLSRHTDRLVQENSRVSLIRDRIKAHLAAQGMIKGHAGSGSRSIVHEEFLRLSDPRDDDAAYRTGGSSSSTDGSPGRAQSVDSNDPYGVAPRLVPMTSSMRGYDDYDYLHHGRSSPSPDAGEIEFMSQFVIL